MLPRQLEFKELDEKITTQTLTLKDITDKALLINVALREKLQIILLSEIQSYKLCSLVNYV